ncbi:crotonase/enoyl-CoA hydratase family protein [Hydrogenophaga sp.]|uniref:crotonase/enoyl-CoA hydratase family protein n=1 Tax=Hydrogenophaga sp. TaxID=1904254 RepID=UPI003569EC56
MSNEERVRVEVRADGVACVTLVRTDKSNALDGAMFDALIAAGERLRNERGVRAVVLAGEGKGFCAGIDMQVLADMKDGSIAGTRDLVARTHGLSNRFQYAAWIWRELPMPVIAAVHGFALGGGLELALGADMRYATPDARLSIMEVNWGLVPDMGGTVRFYDLMRDDVVRELAFTGRVFPAAEALSYGLVTRVDADPHALAWATAREIAERSPDAVRALKRLFAGQSSRAAAAGLLAETVEQQALLGTPNQMETVFASREGRAPVFIG